MDNQDLQKTEKWLDDWKNNRPHRAPTNEYAEQRQKNLIVEPQKTIKYPSFEMP